MKPVPLVQKFEEGMGAPLLLLMKPFAESNKALCIKGFIYFL
jgi:hypothetical protein